MCTVSARRALFRALRRRRSPDDSDRGSESAPVFWGRIGAYEAVSRQGVLFLLSPDATHPSRRVTGGPGFSTDIGARSSAGS